MYDLRGYGAMIDDSVRMKAYEEALRRVVTPSSVVLDIGAGVGIMALIAARLGARRVIAVEPNPLVRVGARVAVDNGLADRIVFVHGRSQQLELTEQADVLVADLRGGLPNVEDHIEAIVDARQRLLRRDGALIPLRDTVFVAPVQAEEAYGDLLSPWAEGTAGLNLAGAANAMLNQGPHRMKSVDRLLGSGKPIAELEYRTVTSPNIDATVDLPIERDGVVHGFSVWFETELDRGVGFSTAPTNESTVYGRLLLPLRQPVSVETGDRIHTSIKGVFDREVHLWLWRGSVLARDGTKRQAFTSSSAFSNPASPRVREVFRPECIPTVSDDGRIVREVLLGIDGARSFADLVSMVLADYPGRFSFEEEAAEFVRGLLERFGESTLLIEG